MRTLCARLILFSLIALAAAGSSVTAGEITIGESQGSVYRGLVDGFPGIFPFDGVADSLNNSLGAVFKAGVTQERGVAEFPLNGLASMCLAPEDIFDATLTFNIDDVFSTLGPGAELNGEAASEIVVHAYDADGAITASDFQNIQEPLEAVDTTGFGTITDASLGVSGPLAFEVDVASALRARVGTATHFGILFRVSDSPTGTSLDNLGINSAGPAGVGGAAFPFLTITAPLHLADFILLGRGHRLHLAGRGGRSGLRRDPGESIAGDRCRRRHRPGRRGLHREQFGRSLHNRQRRCRRSFPRLDLLLCHETGGRIGRGALWRLFDLQGARRCAGRLLMMPPARRAFRIPWRRMLPLLAVAAVACVLGSVEAAERAERIRKKIETVEQRLAAIEIELPAASAAQREALLQEKESLTGKLEKLKVQLAVLDPADADDIHDVGMVEQVSVTATTSELPTRISPVPTQVVTREQIDAVSTENIEQILALVPGVTLQRNTPFTMGATTLSLQGSQSDHVAILLDGRPFSGGIDGIVDVRDIPAGDIDHIEVVRGPGSAIHGSAAMAGVINIITRQGSERSSVEATVGGGTFDRRFGRVGFGGAAGPARYYVFGQTSSYKPEEQWGDFSTQIAEDDDQTRNNVHASLDFPLEDAVVPRRRFLPEGGERGERREGPGLRGGMVEGLRPHLQSHRVGEPVRLLARERL